MSTVIRLPGSDLRQQIAAAIAAVAAASTALDEAGDEVQRATCRARIADGIRQLEQLERRLPTVPETLSDLVTLAEVAWAWSDKAADGSALALDRRRAAPDLHLATRVVMGVLAIAGTGR